MGALLNPVGPESPTTYWIRRGIVVAVGILLASLVVWLLIPKGTATVTAVPGSATPEPTTSEPQPSTSSGSPSSSPAPTASATPTGPVACDPIAVALTITGFKSVRIGTKQVFTLTVANPGPYDCILEITKGTYLVSVTSGSDLIWTTEDCDKWLPVVKRQTLKVGKTAEFTSTWGLRRSDPGCKVVKGDLRPGTYVAKVTYRETAVQRFVMTLVPKKK